jgi:hypothetical protein
LPELLSDQIKAWQELREGYESLKNVRERDLNCGDFPSASNIIPAESRVVQLK